MFDVLKRLWRRLSKAPALPVASVGLDEPLAPTPSTPAAPLAMPEAIPKAAPNPAPVMFPEPVAMPLAPAAPPAFAPPPPVPLPTTPALDMSLLDEEPAPVGMVPVPGAPGAYMIGLTGEDRYARAVSMLRPGSPIWLQLEPDNPEDSSAIAAVDQFNRVIGYVAPDSWLRDAVYGGGASFAAQVLAAETGSRGYREVVLMVEPSEEALTERRYQPPR